MRSIGIILAGLVVLASGQKLHAQQVKPANLNVGAPRNITFTPVDTSKALQPQGVNGASSLMNSRPYRTPTSSFGLSNFFPTIAVSSWPPKVPNVFVLPQSMNPFQPNPPKGTQVFNNPKSKVISSPGTLVSK